MESVDTYYVLLGCVDVHTLTFLAHSKTVGDFKHLGQPH